MTEAQVNKVVETRKSIVAGVIPNYNVELSAEQERTIRNVRGVLKASNASEITQDRALASYKAFTRDCFNFGVEGGIIF